MRWAGLVAVAFATGAVFGRGEMPPTIQEVKARHEARLMAQPGVVAIGIGRDTDGAEIIVVNLDRERPEVRAQVPQTLDGYAVRVQVIGPMRAQ